MAVSVDAYGLHVGMLYIRFYALILIAAMGVGAWVTARRAREQGMDEKHVWDGLMWAVIPGIIGARLLFVLEKLDFSGVLRSLMGPLKGDGGFVAAEQQYSYRASLSTVAENGSAKLHLNVDRAGEALELS